MLLGLAAALLHLAQFAIGVFQGQPRLLEFVLDGHPSLQQLLELHAQLFQRRRTLLQIEVELFATLVEARRLLVEALQGLLGGIVLRPQRADPHRQLVRMVLVGTGILANPVEPFAQGVTPASRVSRRSVSSAMLSSASCRVRRASLSCPVPARAARPVPPLFVETAATQYQLLDLGLLRGQLRLQLAVPAALLLDLAPHLLARAFQLALLVAGRSQTPRPRQRGFPGTRAVPATPPVPGRGRACRPGPVAAPDPQEVPADPVAIAADQALAVVQGAALGERLFQGLHRFHPGQPGLRSASARTLSSSEPAAVAAP